MRYIQMKPICVTAVAVWVMGTHWLSKHAGRHLNTTAQSTGWVASMDSITAQFKDSETGGESIQIRPGRH
jgi:hypothetical protein